MTTPHHAQLGLGTVQWGMPYGIANQSGQPSLDEVQTILTLAQTHGVTLLDTAASYGASETCIGALTAGQSRWRIVTKLSTQTWQEGVSAKEAIERTHASVRDSLTKLRLNTLDTLLLHLPWHRTCCDGAIWHVLLKMRRAGLIQRLGISAIRPEDAWQALEIPQAEVIQVASSLLDQRLSAAGYFARARDCGKEIHIRSVFLQGIAFISPSALPPHLAELAPPLLTIHDWCRQHNVPVGAAFLHHARRIGGHTVLTGCEQPTQAQHNLAWWDLDHPALNTLDTLAAQVGVFEEHLMDPSQWGRR